MLIVTKFNMGQSVWVIDGGNLCRRTIDTISVYRRSKPTYEFKNCFLAYEEDKLFATKKEALAKMTELKTKKGEKNGK